MWFYMQTGNVTKTTPVKVSVCVLGSYSSPAFQRFLFTGEFLFHKEQQYLSLSMPEAPYGAREPIALSYF